QRTAGARATPIAIADRTLVTGLDPELRLVRQLLPWYLDRHATYGVLTWLVYPPVTRVTRVQFPDGKLLLLCCAHTATLFVVLRPTAVFHTRFASFRQRTAGARATPIAIADRTLVTGLDPELRLVRQLLPWYLDRHATYGVLTVLVDCTVAESAQNRPEGAEADVVEQAGAV
ncbi:hypothetical protein GN958_ATG04185, partial [Phytophthora infestans]